MKVLNMKRSKIKLLGKVGYYFILLILLSVAGIMILSTLNIPGGFKLYTVQSGSMEPALKTGSVVLSKPSNEYAEGDIITFKSQEDRNNPKPAVTTTHRIVGVEEKDDEFFYTTKGDANNGPDGNQITRDLILGKVVSSTPLIGYLIGFSRTPTGLITLVIIPATIIVYNELLNIKSEIKKLIEKRRSQKDKFTIA